MKSEITCTNCGNKTFELSNEVGSYDVKIYCNSCGAYIGTFSGYGMEGNNAESND